MGLVLNTGPFVLKGGQMKRKRFPVMLSESERQALQKLAETEGLSGSAVVRRMIRREARDQGLWPTPTSGQPKRQHGARDRRRP